MLRPGVSGRAIELEKHQENEQMADLKLGSCGTSAVLSPRARDNHIMFESVTGRILQLLPYQHFPHREHILVTCTNIQVVLIHRCFTEIVRWRFIV